MIKKDIGWEEYQQIQRMNPSKLVHGVKSMKALKRVIDVGYKEPTDAMRTGSGTHCLLLEPDQFESRYCVVPEFHKSQDNVTAQGKPTDSKATTYYKNAVKDFAKQNSGREFVSREQYDTMLHAIEALRSHKEASRLIDACGSNVELTVLGEICGVQFKGRIDGLTPEAIVDLKTTASVEPSQFGRSFANLHYGLKLAIYRDLIRQSIADRDVVVIAQETSGDFDTVVYDVPSCVLDNGLIKAKRIIEDYKHARKTGDWCGVDRGQTRMPLLVPQWAMEDSGDELVEWSDVPDYDSQTEPVF